MEEGHKKQCGVGRMREEERLGGKVGLGIRRACESVRKNSGVKKLGNYKSQRKRKMEQGGKEG